MAKRLTRKDPELLVEKVILLSVQQACNKFHLTGTTRAHVLKRFRGYKDTVVGWRRLFQYERII